MIKGKGNLVTDLNTFVFLCLWVLFSVIVNLNSFLHWEIQQAHPVSPVLFNHSMIMK